MEEKNPYVIKSSELSAGYGREVVVDGINLTVKAGEILCLIGPNGSGKSTILKTLTRELEALGGKIFVLGKDAAAMNELEAARHLSMVMTEKIRPEFMSCREVVESARYPYTGRLGILRQEDREAAARAIKIVGAEELCDKTFGKVSDGQKQRIMLARAIAQDTEIIVLDEPTSFLDMRFKIDLIRVIKRLAKVEKKTVIMSLHELELAKAAADTIVCVGQGKILKAGKPDEIFCGDFIQKLYGIKESEFDNETARLKIEFEEAEKGKAGVLGGGPLGEGVADKTGAKRGLGSEGESSPHLIMIQGTMSSAGKSLLAAGLCRIFKQDGWRVAPFKSQNMALNSYVTSDGLEMGRAQVMQAEAAGVEPSVLMNPILLKPTSDRKSQVIVNGRVVANMDARDYFEYKKELKPAVMEAFGQLAAENDIIVIEGAGSPAEINLRENDIVNMGLARMLDAPVLLVGDIDRGGVFAQLLGTLDLLTERERERVKGLVINKFRGDVSLLEPGLKELEARGGVPVTGVVPYMKLSLDDEDSLTERFASPSGVDGSPAGGFVPPSGVFVPSSGGVKIGVVRLPHISNFSDFSVFDQFKGKGLTLSYIDSVEGLKKLSPDMIILPGSKNTIGDLRWLKECGLAAAVKDFAGGGDSFRSGRGSCGGGDIAVDGRLAPGGDGAGAGNFGFRGGSAGGGPVIGICGGFQMLGEWVSDPDGVEGEAGSREEGLGLLKLITELEGEKVTRQVRRKIEGADGFFDFLNGKTAAGYEIHAGKSLLEDGKEFEEAVLCSAGVEVPPAQADGTPSGRPAVSSVCPDVLGTYIHGFFDQGDIAVSLVKALSERKGLALEADWAKRMDYKAFKESQYDLLADSLRKSLDMKAIYDILGLSGTKWREK